MIDNPRASEAFEFRKALRHIINRALTKGDPVLSVLKGQAFKIVDTLSTDTVLKMKDDLKEAIR
jgi:hypothetical protein